MTSQNYVGGFEGGLMIPVKFHLVVDDNGQIGSNSIANHSTVPFQDRVNTLLTFSNALLRANWRRPGQNSAIPSTVDCGIQLYLKDGINIIPNTTVNNGDTDQDAAAYKAMHKANGNFDYVAINVYLVNSITGNTP